MRENSSCSTARHHDRRAGPAGLPIRVVPVVWSRAPGLWACTPLDRMPDSQPQPLPDTTRGGGGGVARHRDGPVPPRSVIRHASPQWPEAARRGPETHRMPRIRLADRSGHTLPPTLQQYFAGRQHAHCAAPVVIHEEARFFPSMYVPGGAPREISRGSARLHEWWRSSTGANDRRGNRGHTKHQSSRWAPGGRPSDRRPAPPALLPPSALLPRLLWRGPHDIYHCAREDGGRCHSSQSFEHSARPTAACRQGPFRRAQPLPAMARLPQGNDGQSAPPQGQHNVPARPFAGAKPAARAATLAGLLPSRRGKPAARA